MPWIPLRILAAGCSAFFLYWSGIRLECLFYSAFEYAQAELIRQSVPAPLRAAGVHCWTFSRFYPSWHVLLLGLYYSSVLHIFCQAFLPLPAAIPAAVAYGLYAMLLTVRWHLQRTEARDHRRHIPWNTFAPLHEKQRRELNRMRNGMKPTRVLQWLRYGTDTALTAEQRQRTEQRFSVL